MAELHVVFGAGALGSALAEDLLARGLRVRMVSRSGKGAVAGAEGHAADASDPAAATAACAGATAVYQCAAPPYTEWAALLPPLQAGVLAGAAAAGARLVSAENVYPYGRTTAPMTEDTPLQPCSKKGEIRARLNEALLAAHRAGTVKAALVRGPDYFGPRAAVTTLYGDQVFPAALSGATGNVFGRLDVLHTFASARDFARGLASVGQHDDAMGTTWHVPCPPPLTQQALLDSIWRAAGQPKTRVRAMPGWMTRGVGWFSPLFRELAEMQYQWEQDYVFTWERFGERFGRSFQPHDDAVRETLDWFRSRT